jgi:hypothetical protein
MKAPWLAEKASRASGVPHEQAAAGRPREISTPATRDKTIRSRRMSNHTGGSPGKFPGPTSLSTMPDRSGKVPGYCCSTDKLRFC